MLGDLWLIPLHIRNKEKEKTEKFRTLRVGSKKSMIIEKKKKERKKALLGDIDSVRIATVGCECHKGARPGK
jgi:hypothetical protein